VSRIGFLVLYSPGHLNPSLALAGALRDRGHDIVFFNLPDVEKAATSAGIPFVPFGEQEFPLGSLPTSAKRMGELTGPAAFAYFIERMSVLIGVTFAELPEIMARAGLDGLIVDQLYPGGATVAEHLNLPFISLNNALILHREPNIPPPAFLLPFDMSPEGTERNEEGWRQLNRGFAPLLRAVNQRRRAWNLPSYSDFLQDSFSPVAQISQQPPSFEFPRQHPPANLHFVGPLRDTSRLRTVPFPFERLDGRPLIYASLGTLQNRLKPVFDAIIQACRTLPAQVVVALGQDALSPESFDPVPENVLLFPYVPQEEILKRAAFCITHAGLNTVLDCLSNGVPMVAIPIASEQPGIAMRLAYCGAAKVLRLEELQTETLRAAIQTVFETASYREAAGRIADEIAGLRPLEEACSIIERAVGGSV
jgi:zeaxanthin glucosyltransferase